MSMIDPTPASPLTAVGTTSPPWLRELARSVSQGHHPILHGGVHDLIPWRGDYLQLPTLLDALLTDVGYETIAFYDLIDGMVFADTARRDSFEALTGRHDHAEEENPPAPDDPPITRRVREHEERQRQLRGALGAGRASLREPRDALAAARRALSQNEAPVAVVVRYADVLLQDPSFPDRVDRETALWVKAAGHAARLVGPAGPGQLRNLLVLVAEDLDQIPRWLHHQDPLFAPVQVQPPDPAARRAFLSRFLDRFHGTGDLDDTGREEATRLLTDLTDGMWHWDLDALRRTSVAEQIPVTAGRRLNLMYRYGQRDDPFEQLTMARIREIGGELRERVMGQDHAVDAVVTMLGRARLGLGADPDAPATRPRGVFFFVGPTGVGKTELAKALAQALFGDEAALARFDMSNYKQEHTALRLVGAPPSYVGHGRGGELTNRVIRHPHSVVLFDEIEKAHDSLMDLFLQVLDGGRLTDGNGQDAHFGDTVVIFTSNIGSAELYERIHGIDRMPAFAEVEDLYQQAVKGHFLELGRPELLGKLGKGIVAFDVLREASMDDIARKELDRSLASLRRDRTVEVDWPPVLHTIRTEMARADNLALGGRAIGNLIRQLIEGGLTDWWLDREPPARAGLRISATADGRFTFASDA